MENSGSGAVIVIVLVLGLIALSLASLAFWIWSIIDAVRYTEEQYQAVGQSKTLWIVLLVLLGVLASLLYVLIPRPRLKRA